MLLAEKYKKDLFWIKKALYNCYFEDLEDANSFEEDVFYPFKEGYDNQVDWASGATKGVLIFKNLGFVIKIPFVRCDGEDLYGADDAENKWDYCEQESVRYEQYSKAGFNDIFLKTEFIDYVNDHPIYIQELAIPLAQIKENDESHKSCSNDEIEKVKKLWEINDYEMINSEWEADILTLYGEEYYCNFMKFIIEYTLDDLRDTNIGYVGKKPIILDYAGFNN